MPEDLITADEIFVCNTGVKILPVERFEDRTLEAPGPVTSKLMELMERIINFSDDRFKDWFSPLQQEKGSCGTCQTINHAERKE